MQLRLNKTEGITFLRDIILNISGNLFANEFLNEAKSVAGNHWLRLPPSVALLRGQI